MAGDSQDGPDNPPGFGFAIATENTNAVLIELLMQTRASVDALAVLVIRVLGDSEESRRELAVEYERLHREMLLKHAFRLQEQYPPKTRQEQTGGDGGDG